MRKQSPARCKIPKPPTPRPTIFDIARECGVSPSTVSRALSGQPYVNEETRRRITEVAQALGYRVSTVARALRTQRSASVGVLMADITNPVFPWIVKGIDDVLINEGCTLFLCNTEESEDRQIALVRSLLDRQVDGLILISQSIGSPALLDLLKGGPPCVVVNRRIPDWRTDYVGLDNRGGIAQAVDYLAAIGHRRIGYIAGPAESSASQERLTSFKASLRRHRLPWDPQLIVPGDYSMECGQQACRRFMGLAERPSAVLASNDFSALGVIEEAVAMGLRVPGDISLIGFDDIFISSMANINLTTVHQPKRELGMTAAKLLLQRIKSKGSGRAKEIIMPTELRIRGSCAPVCAPTLVSG